MSHSIAEARHRDPMWYFERNYSALLHLLESAQVLDYGYAESELSDSLVKVSILEKTRYTFLIELQQCFSPGKRLLPDLEFHVRVYLDAKLAEVVSYQGSRHLKARYSLPNNSMFHPDEKRQSNLLLYDWLSACGRLNFKEPCVVNYQS